MEKLIILKIFDMNILYHYFSNVHIVFNAKYTLSGKLYTFQVNLNIATLYYCLHKSCLSL